MVAFGADLVVLLDLLAEQRGLAAVAAHEDPLGHAFGFGVPVPGTLRPRFLGHGKSPSRLTIAANARSNRSAAVFRLAAWPAGDRRRQR